MKSICTSQNQNFYVIAKILDINAKKKKWLFCYNYKQNVCNSGRLYFYGQTADCSSPLKMDKFGNVFGYSTLKPNFV